MIIWAYHIFENIRILRYQSLYMYPLPALMTGTSRKARWGTIYAVYQMSSLMHMQSLGIDKVGYE